MTKAFDARFSNIAKEIYKLAYETPAKHFKERAFQTISPYLEIDAGTWITRGDTDAHFYESDAYAYALPSGFVQQPIAMEGVANEIQTVFQTVFASPGKTFDILDILPKHEWLNSDMYQKYCKEHSLNHSLMTVQVEPHNQVINLITYARHDESRPFSQEVKRLSEWLQPCLVEGLKINLLNGYQPNFPSAHYGVFDSFGYLIEAEDSLLKLLKHYKLMSDFKLNLNLLNDKQQHSQEFEDLIIHARAQHGLVLVEVLQTPLVDRLTERQIEICRLLITGKTNKEIAKVLHLSPNTIHNHLKRIFQLLNVSSRHQAIAYLMRQENLD